MGVARTQNFIANLSPPDEQSEENASDSESIPTASGQEIQVNDGEVERLAQMLPAHERAQFVAVLQATMSHSGPLPTPKMLSEYEAVLPGLAERIVCMPEREQSHRHKFSDEWLKREARLKDRGQIFGMIALVIVLSFCLVLAFQGQAKIAGAVAIALVVGVVGIFVTGKFIDARVTDSETKQE